MIENMAEEHERNENDQEYSEHNTDENMLANLMTAVNGGNQLETVVQAYAQEYENLDQTLDEIDSYMTKLEQQNDTLSAELDELLESSRQARKELREQNQPEEQAIKDEEKKNSEAS